MSDAIKFYEFALEHANEVFNLKADPFACPLTGEQITDATIKEMAILYMLADGKDGDEGTILKLREWHGLTIENIEGIKSLKGLRYFK